MAAIDFPASPTNGQVFTAGNGVVYMYNGTLWLASGASGGGDFYATGSGGATNTVGPTTVIPTTIISGNVGTYYNTANGRWTPPAGRYSIFGHVNVNVNPGAASFSIWLYKNGTGVTNVLASYQIGAGFNGTGTLEAIVDANGSDYFELRHQTTAAGTLSTIGFGAFPISGIKGPPGDMPTGGGIVREYIGVAPIGNINLFNLGAYKGFDIHFHLEASGPAASVAFQTAIGSSVTAGTGYFQFRHYGSGVTASADAASALPFITLASGATGVVAGRLTIPRMANGTGVFQLWHHAGGVQIIINGGMLFPVGDGFNFGITAGSFTAASYVRVIGWP